MPRTVLRVMHLHACAPIKQHTHHAWRWSSLKVSGNPQLTPSSACPPQAVLEAPLPKGGLPRVQAAHPEVLQVQQPGARAAGEVQQVVALVPQPPGTLCRVPHDRHAWLHI
jgi:hypothetical protein